MASLLVMGVFHRFAALSVAGQLGDLSLNDGRSETQELRSAYGRSLPRRRESSRSTTTFFLCVFDSFFLERVIFFLSLLDEGNT